MDVSNATHAVVNAVLNAAKNHSGDPDGVVLKLSSSAYQAKTGIGNGVYAAVYFDTVTGQDTLSEPKLVLTDPVLAADLKQAALDYSLYEIAENAIRLQRQAGHLVRMWLTEIQTCSVPAE